MNQLETDAYVALADGRYLIDPRYAHDPIREEQLLKAQVKKAWSHRKHFQSWVEAYIAKWAKSAAGQGNDMASVRSSDEGRAVGVAGDAGHG